MPFVELSLPPGLLRLGTEFGSEGRWRDSHLVRWKDGLMGPIGGWSARTASTMTGKARAMITWRDDSSVRRMAVGTHSKLYALTQSQTTPVDITPAGLSTGMADASAAGGYGSLDYGEGTYGTARADMSSIQEAGVWSLDNWGGDLLACLSDDGRIFRWQLNDAVVAAALGGSAPTSNRGIVVTGEKFLFALGAGGNKRLVQWADRESLTTWTPASTNQAGSKELATSAQLMCGKRLRGVTGLWTEQDFWVADYRGLPSVYGFTKLGDACGAVSKQCVAVVDGRAFWMSRSQFFYSDGGVVTPLPCEVQDAVFGNINSVQLSKVWAMSIAGSSEVWWGFPTAASTEIDKVVVYNYAENHWSFHTITRLCGADRGVFQNPLMVDSSGYIYDHETGYSYTGATTTTPYAESGPFQVGDGDRIAKVRELVPDEKTQGDVTVSFYVKDWPNASTETTYGPYTLTTAIPTQTRFAARQAKMRVTGSVATSWRWGRPRVEVVTGGRR